MPHCECGVLEAGIPLHLVVLNSYGQVVFKHCRYWIALSKKHNGRHGLMYFDIALNYHATIKVDNMNKNKLKTQSRIKIPAPYRLPSPIGSDMLTARVIAAGGNQP